MRVKSNTWTHFAFITAASKPTFPPAVILQSASIRATAGECERGLLHPLVSLQRCVLIKWPVRVDNLVVLWKAREVAKRCLVFSSRSSNWQSEITRLGITDWRATQSRALCFKPQLLLKNNTFPFLFFSPLRMCLFVFTPSSKALWQRL